MIGLLAIAIAYLVGSLPTGVWVARTKGIPNIRLTGSGNSGATNVGRALGVPFFLFVFLVDALKVYAVVWGACALGVGMPTLLLVAIAGVLGNTVSPFLGFAGGKGVASSMGVLTFLCPWLAGVSIVTWLLVLAVTRIAGVASVVALTVGAIVACLALPDKQVSWTVAVLAGWCVWRHKDNIVALRVA